MSSQLANSLIVGLRLLLLLLARTSSAYDDSARQEMIQGSESRLQDDGMDELQPIS